jgi:hypothetical protein
MNDYADSGNQQNYYAEAPVSVLYPETVFVGRLRLRSFVTFGLHLMRKTTYAYS